MPLDEKRKFGKRNHFDWALRREDSIGEKVDYILGNPVGSGLAENRLEYRWLWRETGDTVRRNLQKATGGTPVLHHLDRTAGFLSRHYCLRACSCKITQHIQRPGGHAAVLGKTSLRTFAAFLPGSKEVIGPRHSLPPAANEGEPWADGLHGCRTNA